MAMEEERKKKRRIKGQLNKPRFSWIEHQLVYNTRIWMDVKNQRRMKRRNEAQLHKRKKLPRLQHQENISGSGNITKNKMWQHVIPDNILSYISDLLPLPDFVIFRSVCRDWRNAPSRRSSIVEFSLKDPWCILYDFDTRDRDMCLFYQVGVKRSCSVKLPNLRGATCFVSKHHWLLLRRDNNYMFFHPLSLEEIRLPPYPAPPFESTACQVATFLYLPTTPDLCTVVLVSSRDPSTVEIAYCPMNVNGWLINKVNVDVGDVAIGHVLLPHPRFVAYLPPYYVIICYKTHWLSYEIRQNIFRTGKVFPNEGCLGRYSDWYSMLREVHSDDLLSKFGDEVSLSFSLFNCLNGADTLDASYELKRTYKCQVFGTEAQTPAGAFVVKAVWM